MAVPWLGSSSRPYWAAIALCALTLLAWSNSFHGGFVLDNEQLILSNARVHAATVENLALIFQHSYWWPDTEAGLYRPLTTLSYLFNYAVLGNADHPAGYHWFNMLLHLANVLLVFALARRLVKDLWLSFLIAAIWAVHPVLTESVTNIVGRADLLAGMTTLSGLLMYLKSTETQGARRFAWLAGLGAVTMAGVFSKESAVAVVGVIALYEFTWPNRKRLRGLAQGGLALAPALLALWWARWRVLAGSGPDVFAFVDNPIVGADWLTGRLTAVKVMANYLGLLLWPSHLSADYSYSQITLFDGRRAGDWLALVTMIVTAAVAALLYRRNKVAFFGASFAFLTLLPASNLIFPIGTIMAERLLYLSAAGFSICMVLALVGLTGRVRRAPLVTLAAGLAIVAAFAARTWIRNLDWRDGLTFWSAAVRTSPLSFKTHKALANELFRPEHFDLERGLQEDARCLAILDPLPDRLNDPSVYDAIGRQFVEIGDGFRVKDRTGTLVASPESMAKYKEGKALLLRGEKILYARRESPSKVLEEEIFADLMLSEADQRLGNRDEALRWVRKAREARPMLPVVYARLFDVLLLSGRRDDALNALVEGVLLTSEPALDRKLLEYYANHPGESNCAISYAEVMPAVDYSCPSVRSHVCAVSGDAVRSAIRAGRTDRAAVLKSQLASKYGCAP